MDLTLQTMPLMLYFNLVLKHVHQERSLCWYYFVLEVAYDTSGSVKCYHIVNTKSLRAVIL